MKSLAVRTVKNLIYVYILSIWQNSPVALAQPSLDRSAGSNTAAQSECILKYGFTEWKPLQYLNSQGKPVGLQVNLIEAVVKKAGCKIKYIPVTWDENMRKIATGELDFTANATPSKKRESYARFSAPYRKDEFAVFVKQELKEKFNTSSIQDLVNSNFRLGLTRQYIYGEEIQRWQNHPMKKYLLSYSTRAEDNIDRLFNGDIDGFLEDPFVISYKLRSRDLMKKVVPLSIRTFGREACFMFNKQNFSKNFIERFNQALEQIKSDPAYQTIWLSSQY
ncbi:MAG: transporter substrate-binding domain-containing protein [Kangiellaceae bacterium]|nr:transporter substrate-binding domain-containing protein [Kangiellaceae bacterium]